jgi:anti-sigma B factor antagonist
LCSACGTIAASALSARSLSRLDEEEGLTQVDFSMSRQTVAGYPVLTLRGEADISSAHMLRDGLTELIDSGGEAVVVDLTEVTFLDSTGLGVLVGARNAAVEAKSGLPIACEDGRILKLFRITGLDNVFDIHPSVDAAVQSLGPRADSA